MPYRWERVLNGLVYGTPGSIRARRILDKLLIINRTHLRRVMCDYVEFFNTTRPYQGLDQRIPVPKASGQGHGPVRCRNVLGGIIHDYYRDAA